MNNLNNGLMIPNYVNGRLTFLNNEPYLQVLEEDEYLDIKDDDMLVILWIPRGGKRPYPYRKRKADILPYRTHFEFSECRLYPGKGRKLVFLKDNITTLFDYEPGDKVTVVTDRDNTPGNGTNHYGTVIGVLNDLKSFEIRTTDNKIKKFKFSEVDYILTGHRPIEF